MSGYENEWAEMRALMNRVVDLDHLAILELTDEVAEAFDSHPMGRIMSKIKSHDRLDKLLKIIIEAIPMDEPQSSKIIEGIQNLIRFIKLSKSHANYLLEYARQLIEIQPNQSTTIIGNFKLFIKYLDKSDPYKTELINSFNLLKSTNSISTEYIPHPVENQIFIDPGSSTAAHRAMRLLLDLENHMITSADLINHNISLAGDDEERAHTVYKAIIKKFPVIKKYLSFHKGDPTQQILPNIVLRYTPKK